MNIGQFGRFEFTIRKKKGNKFFVTYFIHYGTIIDADPLNIEIVDCDDKHWIISKRRIIKFDEETKNY
jgi:hypothetical protein